MTLDTVRFEDHECVRLTDGATTVWITVSAGPRILGLAGRGENVMVVAPDAAIDVPGVGRYRLRGGHRLWAAPEVPAVTYQPDDLPCAVSEVENGVRASASPDGAGLAKSITVRPHADGGWVVDHEIRNESNGAVTLAPWAVTMLRPGGEAVLAATASGAGLLPDRAVVLWPYTDPADARIAIERDAVRVRCEPGPTVKLGVASLDGRVTYRIDGETFEKAVDVDASRPHADLGAAVQVYASNDVCEAETLGPLERVEAGGSVLHGERWSLRADAEGPA